MPHCILELTDTVPQKTEMMRAALVALDTSGLFATDDIKVRMLEYPSDSIYHAVTPVFVHVTIYLLSGRTDDQKHQLSADVYQAVLPYVEACRPCSVSVNLIDMDRGSYVKKLVV